MAIGQQTFLQLMVNVFSYTQVHVQTQERNNFHSCHFTAALLHNKIEGCPLLYKFSFLLIHELSCAEQQIYLTAKDMLSV